MLRENILISAIDQLAEIKTQHRKEREEQRVTIGKIIADMRQEAGLTQTEFAKVLGVSRVAIANYESGKRQSISKKAAEKILKACTRGKR